jgi:hypothetical protein
MFGVGSSPNNSYKRNKMDPATIIVTIRPSRLHNVVTKLTHVWNVVPLTGGGILMKHELGCPVCQLVHQMKRVDSAEVEEELSKSDHSWLYQDKMLPLQRDIAHLKTLMG